MVMMAKSPKLLVLEDFIFPALEIESICAQEFMASIAITGLHRSIQSQLMDLTVCLEVQGMCSEDGGYYCQLFAKVRSLFC